MGDVPFSNEVEIVRAELNFPDDVSKGEHPQQLAHRFSHIQSPLASKSGEK